VRWLAKLLLLYAPGWLKARACRDMSARFTALAVKAAAGNSDSCAAALAGAAREAGAHAGESLKRDLRLGGGFEDAELAWRIVCKFSGMTFRVERQPGRSVFNHIVCPLLEAGGRAVCEGFCVPFVEGFTEAVCPACSVSIVEEAAAPCPCKKALVEAGGADA